MQYVSPVLDDIDFASSFVIPDGVNVYHSLPECLSDCMKGRGVEVKELGSCRFVAGKLSVHG